MLAETLQDALSRHAIPLPDEQIQQLDRYRQLLWDRNQTVNLTRHCDYEKFVGRDVLDSLQLAGLLQSGQKVLDVGTGGGVPGVILAIVRPDIHVELCDSVRKKASAVESIVRELNLSVPVHPVRAEELLETRCYDVVTARAVGPLWKMLRWVRPHWKSAGKLVLIKGPNWFKERQEARSRGLLLDLELRRLASYPMPGTDSTGVILGVWPSQRREQG